MAVNTSELRRELEELVARVSPAVVTEPGKMLANFVARYG